jgi:hypothetical protein
VLITPSIYKAGEAYEGTMTVPYTGSNGGTYPEIVLGPVNGLTATLQAGNFTSGAGTLVFSLTGTPTVTTPETTTFSIEVGGQSCDAVVGVGDGIAPGDLIFYATDEINATVFGSGTEDGYEDKGWLSYYVDDLPVIDGKLQLDGYFGRTSVADDGQVSFNPRLRNISDSNVKFWFSAMTTVDNYNTANIVLQPDGWVNLDNGIYYGFGENSTMTNPTRTNLSGGGINVLETHSEVVTLDLALDNKWYRIYYYPIVDNKDQTAAAGMVRKIYMSIQRLY